MEDHRRVGNFLIRAGAREFQMNDVGVDDNTRPVRFDDAAIHIDLCSERKLGSIDAAIFDLRLFIQHHDPHIARQFALLDIGLQLHRESSGRAIAV